MTRNLRAGLVSTWLSIAWLGWGVPGLGVADVVIAEDELLDVGILVLDPGRPKKSYFLSEYQPVLPEVRQSEATFMAVHLAHTLQATGQFGLVRVVPRESRVLDLTLTGKIRNSTGRRLDLELEVTDATGRRWLGRRYKQKADPFLYAQSHASKREPYQDLYDRIAEDLVKVQRRFRREQLEDLRRVSELQYAAQLAPSVFNDYLVRNGKGRIDVDRLPSRDDPMLARVRRIQQRDEYFLDLLTERYQAFYAAIVEPYFDYRATRFEVEIALSDTRAQANLAYSRALFAPPDRSPAELRRIEQRADFFRLKAAEQARYLEDISLSFAVVVEPMYVELDGEVLRLEGTIEDQYSRWRKMLAQIFESETGLPSLDTSTRPGSPTRY